MASTTVYRASRAATVLLPQGEQITTPAQALSQLDNRLKDADVCMSSFPRGITPELQIKKNGFVSAALEACRHSQHLIIRPDDVWLAIVAQYTLFVNANAGVLRSQLTSQKGDENLIMVLHEGDPESVDWNFFAEQIASQALTYLRDPLHDWVTPRFSTTTSVDRIVAGVTMMSRMQGDFSYTSKIQGGLPSVTLLGVVDDWKEISYRIKRLLTGGGQPARFGQLLQPIVKYFIRSFEDPKGAEVVDFWGRMFTSESSRSGLSLWTGWLTTFMFWGQSGRPTHQGKSLWKRSSEPPLVLDGLECHALTNEEVPPAFYTVPITIFHPDGATSAAEMLAGSIGVQGSSSGRPVEGGGTGLDTRQPVTGWWVFRKGDGNVQEVASSSSGRKGDKDVRAVASSSSGRKA